MEFDLNSLAAYAVVVERGSFTAAAKELGVTKSAVSRQISALEHQMGVRLLNRTTRRLSVTEAGAAVYERAQRVVAEAQDALLAAGSLSESVRGRLRINAPMTFGEELLAPVLPEFMAAYPELEVELSLDDRIVDLVGEGFDVGVRIAAMTDSSLIMRRLAPVARRVCGSPAYFEEFGRPEKPEDLPHHQCLQYSLLVGRGDWSFRRPDGGTVSVKVDGRFHANNGSALLEAALRGCGLYWAPDFITYPHLVSGALEVVLEAERGPDLDLALLYPHRRHLSSKVRVFVDFMIERFGPETAPWVRALGGYVPA